MKEKLVKEVNVEITRHIRVFEHPHTDGSITWSVELSDGKRKPFKKFWFNDIAPALSLQERLEGEGGVDDKPKRYVDVHTGLTWRE